MHISFGTLALSVFLALSGLSYFLPTFAIFAAIAAFAACILLLVGK